MVQSNAILFGWNSIVVGREGLAAELFAHTVNFFEKAKASNLIETFEPVFLSSHGGDLNGFFLIKGTHVQLDTLRSSDDFVDITLRAGMCLTNVGVIDSYVGSVVNEVMMRWMKSIPAPATR
jgi:hypothetical protein